jgi:rSAM/selenodomain-associated transferase 1
MTPPTTAAAAASLAAATLAVPGPAGDALIGDTLAGAEHGGAGPGRTAGKLAAQVIVIAKEPVPGRVKTRLTPPFSPRQAADLARAALADTLAAAAAVPAARHVIALDGTPGPWLPAGARVLAQRGAGLDERIAAALADAYSGLAVPVVLIGMDTPQVTPALLEAALRPLADGTADAVFGPAADGGFWLLGLRRPDPSLVLGVPMSTEHTGVTQLARLAWAGLRIHWLPLLRDVDTAADAYAVAREAPRSRFAAALAAMPGLNDGALLPAGGP